MIQLRFSLAFVLLISSAIAGEDTTWLVGLASCDITPNEPVRMAGYGSKEREQPFESIASRLHAKAMSIQDESGRTGLLVTTDLIGLTRAVAQPLYERITEETGLAREHILINSSHTHSGPVVKLQFEGDPSAEKHADATIRYTQWLTDRLVDLAVEAMDQRSPARLSWGVGIATFVMNRREHTERGVRLGVNPRGLADRSVPLLKIETPDGVLRGVLFGSACHNTTLTWRDMQISGDYAGHAQVFVERELPDVQAMFMQGCGGDANPYPSGSEEVARIHGMTLGGEVLRLLRTELTPVNGPLRMSFGGVKLPINTNLSDADFAKLEKASGATAAVARELRERRTAGNPLSGSYNTHVGLWQFGAGLTLVALPGEVVVDYVPLIETAIGPRNLWVSAYNHDVFGYLPSVRTLAEGGYEMRGIYSGGIGIFDSKIEDVIVKRVCELATEAQRPMLEAER